MNIAFLTLVNISSLAESNIYTDLLREFVKLGHSVYVVSPAERRTGEDTRLLKDRYGTILRVRMGNVQKTNIVEKGVSTVMLEGQFKKAIAAYLKDIRFDLILYSTPPITLAGVVEYLKKRDGAKTYLLLKDIFPQNAVDLGMMSKTGAKGLLYRYFRAKEKKLYAISDRIGCMSQANVEYLLKQDPEIDPAKVEVSPNSIAEENIRGCLGDNQKLLVRSKYGIPADKTVFMYGGNLGRPQDVPFICKCLKACADLQEAFFVICGSGTDYHYLEEYVNAEKPSHVKLLNGLPKDEYDELTAACDIGLIFLDHRFTIPNYPSRLLSYLQCGLPVLCCTDRNTDVGRDAVNGGYGWWCESEKPGDFSTAAAVAAEDLRTKSNESLEYIRLHFTTACAAQKILADMKS